MLTIQADVSLLDKISSYNRLKRITAWMLRFIHNCQTRRNDQQPVMRGSLSTTELNAAEMRWLVSAQRLYFPEEISALRDNVQPTRSRLRPFRPFLDLDGLLRVGGRQKLCRRQYQSRHPVILSGKRKFTKMLIQAEHLRLLHAGPTFVAASLAQRFHILGGRKAIRAITRSWVICRRVAGKARPQLLGQLPPDRTNPRWRLCQ